MNCALRLGILEPVSNSTHLEAPLDELWRRIDARNLGAAVDGEPITRAHLEEWHGAFQAPDAAELALFDSCARLILGAAVRHRMPESRDLHSTSPGSARAE
ncbi:MAG: hypothetical protein R2695_09315 [Acidimicrobiales bacterium]